MSLFCRRELTHNVFFPNGIEPKNVTKDLDFCFTCKQFKAQPDCVSVILELQGLPDDIETKAKILQVIFQLLRVKWGSLESILEDGTLPFCSTCLKAVTEIIILREKLFQIETEVRGILYNLESSVNSCRDTYEKNEDAEGYNHNDLRTLFQKQVKEEHWNKKLLKKKVLEMNQYSNFGGESIPSMVQIQLEKNVFWIVDKNGKSEMKNPVTMCDACTDTNEDGFCLSINLGIFDSFEYTPQLVPVEGNCGKVMQDDEPFKLVSDMSMSDDSDYGSPSKKTKTNSVKHTPRQGKRKKLNFEKNVVEKNRDLKEKENQNKTPPKLCDASTNTEGLDTVKENGCRISGNARSAFFEVEDDDMPPQLEPEGDSSIVPMWNDASFTLGHVNYDENISDDSDYGSPGKGKAVSKSQSRKIKKRKAKPKTRIQVKQNAKKKNLKADSEKEKLPLKDKTASKVDNIQEKVPTEIESINKHEPTPSGSNHTPLLDADEEDDDDEDVIYERMANEDSDSSGSASDHNSDSDAGEAAGGKEDDDVSFQTPSEATLATSEVCRKHSFKPKNARHSKEAEGKYVTIEQVEKKFTAKDKTVWTTKEPNNRNQEARTYEMVRQNGGIIGPAQDSMITPTELFKLMFPPSIVEIIVKHTNSYAKHTLDTNPRKDYEKAWQPVTVEDIYGYIGILIYLGLEKRHRSSFTEAWTKDERYAVPCVAATMSKNRFKLISRFLRFDDKVARMALANEIQDEEESKFCYISDVFNLFVENMQTHLRPYDTLIVDEMLIKFRGTAKFRVYMKSKPGKYGIKFWAVCDVETGYILKISLYEGKVGDTVERELGKKVVLDLVQKYFGSGRGVTMDNFFTSKSLGEELIKQNMSMLGTLNHNRMDVIPEFVDPKGREVQSSVFGFQGNFTMVSYVPKKNRAVLLLSTHHHSAEINPENRNKPKMILDYNATKGAVDTADGMIDAYTCQRRSERWPVKVFYALLDIAAFNAYVIFKVHKCSNRIIGGERRDFFRNFTAGLMDPLIEKRKLEKNPVCGDFVVKRNETPRGDFVVKKPTENRLLLKKIGRCKFCPTGKGKKRNGARRRCITCQNFVCRPCGTLIFHCPNCPIESGMKYPGTNPIPKARKNLSKDFDSQSKRKQKDYWKN